jgi:hypothetical protein
MRGETTMKVYLNEITGIPGAITSMFMSKRTWTRELEEDIRWTCGVVLDSTGRISKGPVSPVASTVPRERYNEWMETLCKWGTKHITMLRYIGLDITVEGLHRAGQDDWDAHAYRFNNRIIRSSTRLAKFGDEMSDWYKDKIISTDEMLKRTEMTLPQTVNLDGVDYVKCVNGYVRSDLQEDKDALRGLYMLSIPSNFIFQINLCEYAHVYKERNINGHANPEVKEVAEAIADALQEAQPLFTRELLMKIKN